MKSYKTIIPLVVVALVAIVIILVYKPASRIIVSNTGADVVEVKIDGSEKTTRLGENGTGYFDSDSKIRIGDAIISVGKRVEVVNKGTDDIHVTHQDTAGSEHTTILGEGGSGYFSKAVPINIGEVTIRIGSPKK
jgi:hypothetical protein